jgi:hypothetical protein
LEDVVFVMEVEAEHESPELGSSILLAQRPRD